MSKYKLKKWYPSLPKDWEVGMLVTKKDKNDIDYNPDCVGYYYYKILCIEVENNPEFWEKVVEKECTCGVFDCCSNLKNCKILASKQPKVVEKDYEILSFIRTGSSNYDGTIFLLEDGSYSPSFKHSNLSLDHCLNSGGFNIYSVKRLSDGEIFTIGDKINLSKSEYSFPKNDVLLEIKVFNNTIRFKMNFQEKHNWDSSYTLDYIKKAKQPLFKTEDSVDIYEGDRYYVVAKKYIYESTVDSEYEIQAFELEINNTSFKQYNWNNFWSFSAKDTAEEFILMNKPLLCLNDIEYLLKDGSSVFEKLKEVVKGKI